MADLLFVTEGGAAHRSAYQNAIRDLDLVESVVLVDPDGETFSESEEICGNKVVGRATSIEAGLRQLKPAMAIVTMKAAHSPAKILPLLDAGIHVMAEKPACVNARDFADLVAIAEKRSVHLMLALANRLNPAIVDAQRIIAEGGIGRIYAVRATQVDDQTRIQRRLDDPDWTFQKSLAGGGHLSWLGIHTVDMIRYLTNLDIDSVAAMTPVVGGAPIDVEDLAMVMMRFVGGAHGSLFSGYLMPEKGHSEFVVYGSEGWVRFNAGEQGKLEWRSLAQPTRVITYDERGGGYTPWVQETLRACLGERDAPITATDSLAALKVVHAAYQAAESSTVVQVG